MLLLLTNDVYACINIRVYICVLFLYTYIIYINTNTTYITYNAYNAIGPNKRGHMRKIVMLHE